MLINEKKLREFVRMIIEDVENDVIKMAPDELLNLVKYTNSIDGILNAKKFRDKKVVISGKIKFPENDKIVTLGKLHGVEGDLDVSSLRNLNSLGQLKFVQGNLNISSTKVSSIDKIDVTGHVSDYNTPIEIKRLRKEYQEKLDEANERRESGEWDDVENNLANNELAAKAHALLRYIDYNEAGFTLMSDEVVEELKGLKAQLETLTDEYNNTEDDERVYELSEEIEMVETRIEEINDEYIDVYDAIPTGYAHYGELTVFNFKEIGGLRNMNEYAVGTTKECDDALEDYWKNLLDDIGVDGIQQYIIENNIDGDSVAEEWEEYYYDEIRDNLDVYFNLDDLELSPEQESRKSDLESYIEELESYIEEMEEKQESLNDEIEEPDEYSAEYDRIQELIDDAEKKKDDVQDEIDEMKGEVTHEMIESEVEDRLYRIRRDPYNFLKNELGYESKTIMNYVDMDGLIHDLSSNSDYSDLSSYDGRYYEYKGGGESYVVMRIN